MKNIIISNPKKLEEIKKKISKEGKDKFHVITDFDRTLTKGNVDGDSKVTSIISILRDGNYLTKDYAKKAHALFDKYYPIEINPNISMEEKKKKMREWWTSHFNLLIKSKLNKKDLKKVIKSEKIKFRKGVLEFFKFLYENNIPLIIMSSAGLGGDSISMYLKKQKCLYDNIHIISNTYKWDKEGNAIGIEEPIIHVFNKTETSVKNLPIYNKLLERKNVILMGDNLEDVGMIEGFPYENLIKVGFLNYNTEENLKAYKKAYDVVILNDGNFNYINKLVEEIVRD